MFSIFVPSRYHPLIGTWDLDHVRKSFALVQILNNEPQCIAQLAIPMSLTFGRQYHVLLELLDGNMEGRVKTKYAKQWMTTLRRHLLSPQKCSCTYTSAVCSNARHFLCSGREENKLKLEAEHL